MHHASFLRSNPYGNPERKVLRAGTVQFNFTSITSVTKKKETQGGRTERGKEQSYDKKLLLL